MADHHQRITETFAMASNKAEKEALQRRAHKNKTASDMSLPIGARVFLRNYVKGRNKIQDAWNNIPHKVVGRPDAEGNVYVVEPLEGDGAQKTVNHSNPWGTFWPNDH